MQSFQVYVTRARQMKHKKLIIVITTPGMTLRPVISRLEKVRTELDKKCYMINENASS